ncbi:MAG: O-antigen ligase family protein [Bacilli bacterium]|nr:O-antigen ligase family protein [Bacilli bacterium]
MGKIKSVLQIVFLFVGIIASALLIENVGFLTHNPTGNLPNAYFYALFALAMLSYFALYFIEHKYNKIRIDFVLFVAFFTLLLCSIIAISTFEDTTFLTHYGESVLVSVNAEEKGKMFMSVLTFVITLYTVFYVFSKNVVSFRKLWPVYLIIILVCYFACIYSLIAEHDLYVQFFESRGEIMNSIKSVFWNENMFGGVLLMGCISCILLNLIRRNAFSYISIFLFAVMALFVGSIISLTCILGLYFVYSFAEILANVKKHFPLFIIILALYLCLMIGIIVAFIFSYNTDMGIFTSISHYVKKLFTNVNFDGFSGRFDLYKLLFNVLKDSPINMVFGYGLGLSTAIIKSVTDVASAHSGYIQILFTFGIVGCLVYLAIIGYFFYAGFRLIKKYTRFSLAFMFVGILMLGYGVGESVLLFNNNTQGLIIGGFFYLPVMMVYKREKNKEKLLEFIDQKSEKVSKSSLISSISLIFVVLLCCVLPFFGVTQFYSTKRYLMLLIAATMALVGILFTYPILIGIWTNKGSKANQIIRVIFNSILIAGLVIASFFIIYSLAGFNYVYILTIVPSTYILLFILEILIYRSNNENLTKILFKNLFKNICVNLAPTAISLLITVLGCVFLSKYFVYGKLIYIIFFAINLVITSFVFILFNNSTIKETNKLCLNNYIVRTKKCLLKENRGRLYER